MFKILVVEDDKELNKTVCTFLNHSGYEATGCLNGDDAYDALYDNMYDLIISDIMMLGVIGLGIACTAYPIYNRTVKKEREKIAPEIIRLTDELMK